MRGRPVQSADDHRPRPDRPQPDRPAPYRDRADGAVQLPPRPAHGRHVHPPPRGHRRRPLLDRLREGHPRRAPLARAALGRGSRGRRRSGPRPARALPPDGAAPAVRGGGRAAPRPGQGLSLLLHARGARRRAEATRGRQAAAPLQRTLRQPDAGGAGRLRGRGSPARAPLPGRGGHGRVRRHRPRPRRDSTSRTSAATS